jgi:xylulose-5-phosphate/fructose-6-phosphate phosphoketolase
VTAIDVARSPSAPEEGDFGQLDAYFRAANYLAAGQIYLMDNPLLRRPSHPRGHQAPTAGPLGDEPRAQLLLRPL